MATAKDNQNQAPEQENTEAAKAAASTSAQATKKSTKRAPKEDPRGNAVKVNGVQLYVKG